MNAPFKPLLSFLLVALSLVPLRADRDRHDDRGRPEVARVVLYSGENFDGVSVELLPGARVANLGDLRFADGRKVADRISSVRIFGDLKVTLFEDTSYRGDSLELDRSVAHLKRVPRRNGGGSWDNRLSSVLVSGGRPGWNDGDRDRHRDDQWRGGGRERQDRLSGPEVDRLVARAYRELLDREPNGTELRHYRGLVFSEGWGRTQIYDDLRGSREYRSREADRIIHRVYRDLLGRDPDPSGLNSYRRKIIDKGWSEERVRSAIRESDEFRRRPDGRPPRH